MVDPQLTWTQWVRRLAHKHGVRSLTDDDIDELLWEHTAWPMGGIDFTERQLVALFTHQKGKRVPKPVELQIHEPVDDLPPVSRSPRASRWDAVVNAAAAADGRWVPVTKPPGYTKGSLVDRYDGIVVEPRGDKIYVKYDPVEAQRRRDQADAKAKADD